MLKLFAEFFGALFSVFGLIGGVLLALFSGDYVFIAFFICVLGYAAYPRVRGWWDDLREARKAALQKAQEKDE